jgi:hypothetical protein
MSDAELIARMLDGGVLAGRMIADRIEFLAKTNEALTAENERLGQQCEGLMRAGMNNGQALILAEAKLAKAVEALRAVEQHEASIFFGPDAEKNKRASWRGVMRKVKAALAEIEGKDAP